jgi:hypothetical protein
MQSEDERLLELGMERCTKVLNAVDRMVVRAWADGYKYGLIDQGHVTEGVERIIPQKKPPEPEPVRTYEVPTDALPQGWRKVYHTRGEYPCGKAALLVTRPVYADEAASLNVLRFVNGQKIDVQDTPNCGGCGKLIHPWSNADLDWMPHKLPVRQKYTMTFGDFRADQTEPGMDTPAASADPTATKSPSSVLAEMRDAVRQPYYGDDEEPSMIGADEQEIQEIQDLFTATGLPHTSPGPRE